MDPNAPSIPSSFEAAHYYYGLPSQPDLIARSSAELWVEPTGAEAYLVAKELKPVGSHAALSLVWEPVIASEIEAYLDSQQVAWTSVDPVRIAYAGGESFPVIIWVGVKPGSLSGEKGVEVALGCRTILTGNGVFDIHVEIRSSETTLQAKLYKPVRTINPTAQAIEPFATTLGIPICGADTPHFEGTGGFFFTDSKRPGKLFLLTARHVLFHPDHTKNEHYTLRSTSQATKKVFLLGDGALEDRIKAIESEIRGKEIRLAQLASRKQGLEGQDDDEAEEERADVERQEQAARKAITALEKLLHDVNRDWKSEADRTVGHVILSPSIDFSVGPNRCTEDWAVIGVDRSRVDMTNFVGNCIDLGTSVAPEDFNLWMCPHPANPSSFKYPGDRLVKFFGTILDSQMGNPDRKTLDHDHDPVIMVIKRGSTSGLTVGRLNSIRSVMRYYFKGKPGQSSREVAVLPRNSKSGAFSEPGDSGSVVIDGKGRVAGILTGGSGTTE
ncbi:hypothetical protein FRB90_010782, partial [Tulasnella sp. 427]